MKAPILPDDLPRHILEATRDIVVVKDRESRVVWANRAFLDSLGKTLDEVRGRRVLLEGAEERRSLEQDARVFETGAPLESPEERFDLADGRTAWRHVVKTPILGPSGRSELLVVIARDVTQTRAASVALDRINVCLLGFGGDSLENIARLTELCGELLEADSAVYHRLEKGVFSAVGRWNLPPDFDPIQPVEGTLCGEIVRRSGEDLVALRGARAGLGRAVKSGDRVLGSLCALFRRDVAADAVSAKILGILASALAVEEERLATGKARARLSEELRQSQKMEAIGQLAGGVAHDFNNTLTTIRGYAEIIRTSEAPPQTRQDAGEILKSVEFATSLTGQLLAFGRRQMLVPRVIDLREPAEKAAAMLARLLPETIRLVLDLPPEPIPVYVDPGQIGQVLMNLAINARDAMPDGGTLTLRARAPAGASPRQALLEVRDTGLGISAEILPHIFEPFFTTKEKGKGTGLGLSTVYGIVVQSGGKVLCDSEPGKGASFRVLLPRSDASLDEAPRTPAPVDLRGRGTVLLVEDDKGIRAMLERTLSAAGYEVLTAADAEQALSLAARPRTRIDVLVTDMVMPGLSGRQLAMRLERDLPGLKVLYMSGYTDDAALSDELRRGAAFLQKPFNPSELCRRLKDLKP